MNELQQLPNPDNIPNAINMSYQRQNTNILAIQTGLDTTGPFDNGNGLITVPAGGVIEVNGYMYKIVIDIALTKPDANIAYWIEVIVDSDGNGTFNLVTRPGKWNPSKQGCYTENNNRTLNWVSLGNFSETVDAPIRTTTNTIGEIWQLPIGWYLFKASNRGWSVLSKNGSFKTNFLYRNFLLSVNEISNININYDDIYINFHIMELPSINIRNTSQIYNDRLYLPANGANQLVIFDLVNETSRTVTLPNTNVRNTSQIYNDNLYLPASSANQMVIFDLINETSRIVTLPNTNVRNTSQIYNDRLYLPASGANQMVIFDLITETSRTVTLPNTNTRFTSQIYNDRLYLPASSANQMVIFDLINETSRIVTLPNTNVRNTSQIYNDNLYLPPSGNQMVIFDLLTETSRTVTLLNNNNRVTSQIYNDKLYLPGGVNQIVIFDLINETYMNVFFPTTFNRNTSQIYNNKIYLPASNSNELLITDLINNFDYVLECYKI